MARGITFPTFMDTTTACEGHRGPHLGFGVLGLSLGRVLPHSLLIPPRFISRTMPSEGAPGLTSGLGGVQVRRRVGQRTIDPPMICEPCRGSLF